MLLTGSRSEGAEAASAGRGDAGQVARSYFDGATSLMVAFTTLSGMDEAAREQRMAGRIMAR